MGLKLERCPVEGISERSDPVLINGVGVVPQVLREALSPPGPQSRVIVCEAARSREFAPLGRSLELPTSYERFQAAGREISSSS